MENQEKNKPKFHPNFRLKFMDHVREVLRYHHCAHRTAQTYCQWVLRYIHHFGGKTHPNRLCAKDVDFGQGLIFVRSGKSGRDRTTILPQWIKARP